MVVSAMFYDREGEPTPDSTNYIGSYSFTWTEVSILYHLVLICRINFCFPRRFVMQFVDCFSIGYSSPVDFALYIALGTVARSLGGKFFFNFYKTF